MILSLIRMCKWCNIHGAVDAHFGKVLFFYARPHGGTQRMTWHHTRYCIFPFNYSHLTFWALLFPFKGPCGSKKCSALIVAGQQLPQRELMTFPWREDFSFSVKHSVKHYQHFKWIYFGFTQAVFIKVVTYITFMEGPGEVTVSLVTAACLATCWRVGGPCIWNHHVHLHLHANVICSWQPLLQGRSAAAKYHEFQKNKNK